MINDSELEAISTLKNKCLMWNAIQFISIFGFIASISFMIWKGSSVMMSGESLSNFILGNINTFSSCALLLLLAWFFRRLKIQTRKVLEKKAEDMIEEEEKKFQKYRR